MAEFRLNRPAGDLWALHGGIVYHTQKYPTAPSPLPQPLHWFRWEAYDTWLTGFALLTVTYYVNADLYLVNHDAGLSSPSGAIAASIGLLAAAWLMTMLFAPRGAFMQLGAMLGTLMAGNVFLVVIPSQRRLVRAAADGEPPEANIAAEAKRRSTHNNYLTLPVVAAMLSPHYPAPADQRPK